MAVDIEKIIQYSDDYSKKIYRHGEMYFSIRIDFDFAMSLPNMERRVYYKKNLSDGMKERLNSVGIWLLVKHNVNTQKISTITVNFSVGCMTEYTRQQDIEIIVDMLIHERSKHSE